MVPERHTLLKVLIGELNADDGVVTWAKGASIGYLAQHQDLEGAETIYDALLEVKKPVIRDGGPHSQPGTGNEIRFR